jgi:hypothetical protein
VGVNDTRDDHVVQHIIHRAVRRHVVVRHDSDDSAVSDMNRGGPRAPGEDDVMAANDKVWLEHCNDD